MRFDLITVLSVSNTVCILYVSTYVCKIVEVEMGIDHAQCSERGVSVLMLCGSRYLVKLPIRKTR